MHTTVHVKYIILMYVQLRFDTSYSINSLQGGRFVLKFVAI